MLSRCRRRQNNSDLISFSSLASLILARILFPIYWLVRDLSIECRLGPIVLLSETVNMDHLSLIDTPASIVQQPVLIHCLYQRRQSLLIPASTLYTSLNGTTASIVQ